MKKIILMALACTNLSAYAAIGPLSTNHHEHSQQADHGQEFMITAPQSTVPYQSSLMRHRYEELLRLAAQDENVRIIDPRNIRLTTDDQAPDAAGIADMQ